MTPLLVGLSVLLVVLVVLCVELHRLASLVVMLTQEVRRFRGEVEPRLEAHGERLGLLERASRGALVNQG